MAMNSSLGYEEWFVAVVKQALEQAESGQVVDHETVLKRLERKLKTKLDPGR